jgi:hypothetical protein
MKIIYLYIKKYYIYKYKKMSKNINREIYVVSPCVNNAYNGFYNHPYRTKIFFDKSSAKNYKETLEREARMYEREYMKYEIFKRNIEGFEDTCDEEDSEDNEEDIKAYIIKLIENPKFEELETLIIVFKDELNAKLFKRMMEKIVEDKYDVLITKYCGKIESVDNIENVYIDNKYYMVETSIEETMNNMIPYIEIIKKTKEI